MAEQLTSTERREIWEEEQFAIDASVDKVNLQHITSSFDSPLIVMHEELKSQDQANYIFTGEALD